MDRNIIENVNGIVKVKQELKNILIILNMNPSDRFDTYAGLFRQKINDIESSSNYILGE